MTNIIKVTILALIILIVPINIYSQKSKINIDSLSREEIMKLPNKDLIDLSLEDLMKLADKAGISVEDLLKMSVETSTKSSIDIQSAPSVIRAYTEEDIKDLGFYTLKDVLNNIPGIQVQEYRAGHQLVWIRGVQARYNNKVLMLIDGVPVRDGYYQNFNIDEMVSLENVKKIEVLNGPGSVLYGANSFSGIISITTKSKGRSVSTSYGSFNSVTAFGEYDLGNFYASGAFFHTDGFQPKLNYDGLPREHPQEAINKSIMLKYNKESFKVIGSFDQYSYSYKYRSSDRNYIFDRTPINLSVAKSFDFTTAGKINILAYGNYFGFTNHKTKFNNEVTDTIKEKSVEYMNTGLFGADIEYLKDFKSHSLIFGLSSQQDMAIDMYENITYDIDEGNIDVRGDLASDPDVFRSNFGFYVQDIWKISNNIQFTSGLRYNILSDFDNQFNYRFGLTASANKNLYFKVLYGTSYRVPSYREYLDAVSYNPDLQPEKLNTLEGQVGYLFGKGDINITFFNNQYSNFIQELFLDSIQNVNGSYRVIDDEMAFNFNKRSISGFELNTIIRPSMELYFNFGATYFLSAKEDRGELKTTVFPAYSYGGTQDIVYLSKYNMFLLTNYRFLRNYTAGFNIIYFSDRDVPADYQSNVPDEVKNADLAKGFVKMDISLSAQIAYKFRLTAKVSNVLNKKIYSPPYGGYGDYDIEWPGTVFRLGLSYNFNKP